MLVNGLVGDQVNATGTSPAAIRQGFTGEVSVGDRHARYMEAVLRGGVYSVTFAAAALAVASATAAGAFVLLNPTGSGKNIVLQDIQTTMTANTPVATGTAVVLGALINPVFSALGTAVSPTSNLVGSSAVNQAKAQAYPSGTYAVLPSVTPPGLRQIAGYYLDLAASAELATYHDEVAGQVIVQPGNGVNVFGLGGTAADVTVTITMTWGRSSDRKLMAKLKAATRNKIPASKFGLPGSRKYPEEDRTHQIAAKQRATQMLKKGKLSPASAQKIRAKANQLLGE